MKRFEVFEMSPKLFWLGVYLLGSFNVIAYAQFCNYGSNNYAPYGYGPQQPIIITRNNDRDGFRDILPLLLILLFADGFGGGCGGFGGFGGYGGGGYGGGYGGGCCNNCGGNCNGGNNGGCNTVPVPYPIAIPCNSPVIT